MTANDMADEIERAMAVAVAELLAHGGTEAQIEMLRAQFKVIADDADAEVTDKKIPD